VYGVVSRPSGSDTADIVRLARRFRVNARVAICAFGAVLSVTWATKLNNPASVAVPERRPIELSVIPAGRAPEASDHV
jgi:hypothetical protein